MPNSLTRISRFGFVNAYLVARGRRPHARRHHAPAQRQGDPAAPPSARRADRADRADPRPRRPHRLARRARRGAARRRGADLRPRRAPAGQGQVARPRRAAGQAARRLPGRQDPADADARARRRASARSRSSPRPGTRPATSRFLDTRDGTLLCGDAFTTLGGVATTGKAQPALPAGQRWRPGTGRRSSRPPARCARWTRRGWRPGHGEVVEAPRRRDGRRDRQGRRLAGAARRARHRARRRRGGADRRRRGPRRRHPGAGGRRARACAPRRSTTTSTAATGCCARSRCAACASSPPRCATRPSAARAPTRSPADGAAYRAYARAHPGSTRPAWPRRRPTTPSTAAAAPEAVDVVFAVLRGWSLEGDDAIHAARGVPQRRPRLRGAGGRRRLRASRSTSTTSFERLVATLAGGLRYRSMTARSARRRSERLGDHAPVAVGGVGLQAQQRRGRPGGELGRPARRARRRRWPRRARR